MQKEIAISVILLLLLISGLAHLAWPPTLAGQSVDRMSSKKEKFGASLKRLKWNPKKQAAEEMKDGNHGTALAVGPGDVINVETNLVVLDLFVTDQTKSRAITGLDKADFVVTEDGVTHQRYIIGYYPTNEVRDGRLRKVRIEVRGHPEYIVHGRQSYSLRPQ